MYKPRQNPTRITYKKRLITAFGSKCCVCGYDDTNYIEVFDFHHIDPSQKEFSISKKIRAWDDLVAEVRKCIMVCSNCHRKLHYGLPIPPQDKIIRFSEEYAIYKIKKIKVCPICGNESKGRSRYCSPECYEKRIRIYKIDWSKYDINDLINVQKIPFTKVAEMIGVCDNAIKKHMKRNGIPIPQKIAYPGNRIIK